MKNSAPTGAKFAGINLYNNDFEDGFGFHVGYQVDTDNDCKPTGNIEIRLRVPLWGEDYSHWTTAYLNPTSNQLFELAKAVNEAAEEVKQWEKRGALGSDAEKVITDFFRDNIREYTTQQIRDALLETMGVEGTRW